MENKTPKRANHAIGLLDSLVEQLHYFYGGSDAKFKKHVLKDAVEIENVLKDLAINKEETFKRIKKRYEVYYRKKQETIDNTVASTNDTKLNDSIRARYKHDFKKDRA